MVIMKDSQDPPWVTVSKPYRQAKDLNRAVEIGLFEGDTEVATIYPEAISDSICTAGRLVLFFKDKIDPKFKLHSKVLLF